MAKLIMVVNDTEEILDPFREILMNEGYDVSLHAYGKREIGEVKQIAPDLLIADFPPLDRSNMAGSSCRCSRCGTPPSTVRSSSIPPISARLRITRPG